MDREQEQMQFLGLFGIFKETCNIVISCRKIFTQITLTFILPLAFIFLAHLEISYLIFREIRHTESEKELTSPDTKRYNNLSDTISSEWITFWLFKVVYITIFLILSLLSTAAVVYTIASLYTGRGLTFKNVTSVVPKAWKRLMVTFVTLYSTFFLYNLLAFFTMFIFMLVLPFDALGAFLIYMFLSIYAMGFVYMTVIWQLASVVSVLESSYGLQAMTKSKDLIKGNRAVAISVFFLISMSFLLVHYLFEKWVVHANSLEAWKRVLFGIMCLLLLSIVFLLGFVIHTLLYLVCKSYHHENIDKGDLSNHLESYLGEYEPLGGKDAQLEQFDV